MAPTYKLDREKVREMRLSGMSMEQIASHFGATRAAVHKLLKQLDGPAPRASITMQRRSVVVKSDVPPAIVADHIANALRRAGWEVDVPKSESA